MLKKTTIISLLALFLSCVAMTAQVKTVTGKVVDSKGEPLAGAGIAVTGTNKGTTTDIDGNFVLYVDRLPVDLSVSYIGFSTANVTARGGMR